MQKNNNVKQAGIMEADRWRKIVKQQQHEKTMEAIRWRKIIKQHEKTMVRSNPDIMIKIRETCFP